MEIIFNPAKDVTVVAEIKKTIDKITVLDITDSPNNKTVTATTMELGRITLWEGTAYDAIGQWTDTDVEARINEIYK